MNAIRRARLVRDFPGFIESLEPRRLLSTIVKRDIDADGYRDLIITDAGNDHSSDIFVYIDFANNRTVIFDDVDNDQLGESLAPGLTLNNPVTTPTNSAQVYLLSRVPESINFSMGGNDDDVVIQLVSDFAPRVPPGFNGLSIWADLGAGNDKFDFVSPTAADTDAQGVNAILPVDLIFDTDGADIISSDVLVEVDGGAGTDRLHGNLLRTSIDNSHVVLNLAGGYGSDHINVALPDQPEHGEGIFHSTGAPSRLDVNIDTGGSGSDSHSNTVNLNIRTELEAGADLGGENGWASHVDIDIEGDAGNDTVNMNRSNAHTAPFFIDTDPFNRFTLDAFLDRGNDRFLALFDFRGFTDTGGEPSGIEIEEDSFVHFGVSGSFGEDWIDFGNDAPPGTTSIPLFGRLEFDLRGGDGRDSLNLHFDSRVSEPNSTIAIGPGGEFAALLFGDNGNDFLEIDVNFVAGVAARVPALLVDLGIYGGRHNDKAVMAVDLGEPDRSVRIGSLAAVLDGGSGWDVYDLDGEITDFFALPGAGIVNRGFEDEDDDLEPNEVV
jgi:hypothetical protein